MNRKSGLLVEKAGLFTQIQDTGRFNQALQGLSQGGLCDELAAGWANYLLGNGSNAPLLEISFGQAKFEALSDINLALTGAPMEAQIEHLSGIKVAQSNNRTFLLKSGQKLLLSYASSGVRAYLAVQGGFVITPILGSVSSVKRNALGGLKGDASGLKEGDILPVAKQERHLITHRIPEKFIPDYHQSVTLGIIESYQCASFLAGEKNKFYHAQYQIDKNSDRMGMRLQGEPISGQLSGIISEGIALGSVQIPADGQPIILLQDRQTLGGYPKLGCIARCDLSLLAQQSVGKKITFKRTELKVERVRYLQRLRFFNC
ncbi:MAG: biotin-dependent carboxyltransferase family protein [Psychromonas sp.]